MSIDRAGLALIRMLCFGAACSIMIECCMVANSSDDFAEKATEAFLLRYIYIYDPWIYIPTIQQ